MRLPFRITICGLEELPGCAEARISHVLSILDPDWPVPMAFGSFGPHKRMELRFHDVIDKTPGMLPPQPGHVEQLLAFGHDLSVEPPAEPHLLVHCHVGVSRSSAAMGLVLAQAMPKCAAAEIFAEIARLRPGIWPNLRIVEMGDTMLGRNGELISAVHDVYRLQIGRKPGIVEQMRAGGRAREIAAAFGQPKFEDHALAGREGERAGSSG